MITDDIDFCVEKLKAEELVAFPTETVFGLGARADSAKAINKIFKTKSRPSSHPLISHTHDIHKALSVSKEVPQYALQLAEKFWPGPMTLVLHCDDDKQISSEARGGHDSVAVRVPSHPVAQELLSKCDFFVAAPSANRFGRVSPTKSQHVQEEFADELIVLDGGQSQVGVESTIISCLEDKPQILRTGKITKEEIETLTGLEVISEGVIKVAASGTLDNHYAPSIPVYLFDDESEIVLKHLDPAKCAVISLKETNLIFALENNPKDVNEYAHELYSFFREAEQQDCQAICVFPPPNIGIGVAVNERLQKASNTFKD